MNLIVPCPILLGPGSPAKPSFRRLIPYATSLRRVVPDHRFDFFVLYYNI